MANPVSMAEALALVRDWHRDRGSVVACPSCGATGLAVADQSARPHREWYALSCSACGFAKTVAIPLGAAVPGGD